MVSWTRSISYNLTLLYIIYLKLYFHFTFILFFSLLIFLSNSILDLKLISFISDFIVLCTCMLRGAKNQIILCKPVPDNTCLFTEIRRNPIQLYYLGCLTYQSCIYIKNVFLYWRYDDVMMAGLVWGKKEAGGSVTD